MYYPSADDQYMINPAHHYYYYHPNEPKGVHNRPTTVRQQHSVHHHHVPFAQRIMGENHTPRVARVHSFTTRVYINHGQDPYVQQQRNPQISRSRPPSFAHR